MVQLKNIFLGTLLTGIIALVATWLATLPLITSWGFSALSLAIILGIIIGNTFYAKMAPLCHHGINFSKQKILRLGIILYGFHITFHSIALVGLQGILLAILIISCTFIFTYYVGVYLLKLDKQLTILIGSGCAICGAAAIMASEPVVKANANKVAIAVAMIVIFGSVSMFLYPLLYSIPVVHNILGSAENFGIWAGGSIHEVAQVVGSAKQEGESALNLAVIIKMLRVMMLAPFLIIVAIWLNKQGQQKGKKMHTPLVIPWFAILFLGVAAFNSWQLLAPMLVNLILNLDTFLLAMAMAALGLHTHLYALKHAGIKPIVLTIIATMFLMTFGLLLTYLLF